MVYSFTNRSNFPKNEEINVEAAYIKVYPMDTMNIICPSNNNEILTIYQVSDLSFMNCELDGRSQIFLICNSSNYHQPSSHRIVFRPFSPLPNGFEYQPGRSYYLISTSNGTYEGMNNTRHGLCLLKNMRLRIDIQPYEPFNSPTLYKNGKFHCSRMTDKKSMVPSLKP
ncbi:unnamed protein product [Dracunculus medinensis]|uniref:Ephrin RBD domain-containing protein n=1 Tax=Dracunculus medinensis TaxID=318479 RepID=A0A0N4U9F5_DRAME|nr:unnamed protein product [Dracunculus medinensis]